MKPLRIRDAAQACGLSAHTLRYYERLGLIGRVARVGGRREYAEADLTWIAFLHRLRATGMPIRQMLRYSSLRRQGEATLAARCELLLAHREAVGQRIAELQSNLATLDEKVDWYEREIERLERERLEHKHPKRKPRAA